MDNKTEIIEVYRKNSDFCFKAKIMDSFWRNRITQIIRIEKNQTGIRKQKYLLFYNLFSKLLGTKYTFQNLKAFAKGPVYDDMRQYARVEKEIGVRFEEFNSGSDDILNEKAANAAYWMVHYLNAEELSKLTHRFSFWIKNHENRKSIKDDDITGNDFSYIKWLYDFFSNLSENYTMVTVDVNKQNVFAIKNENVGEIIKNHIDRLSEKFDYNPVVFYIDEEGDLIVD